MYSGYSIEQTGFASTLATPPPVLADERLMKNWETTGYFWSNSRPAVRLWGTIKYEPGVRIELILEGHILGERAPWPIHGDVGTVYGELSGGTPCTVFSCQYLISTAVGEKYSHRTNIFSHDFIVGGHWPDLKSCILNEVQIRFSHLEQWFGQAYSIKHQGPLHEESIFTFDPDTITTEFIFRNISVGLKSFCGRTIPNRAEAGILKFSYKYNFLLKPSTPQPVDWFFEVASLLKESIGFLIGSGVYTLDIKSFKEDVEITPFKTILVPRAVRIEREYFSTTYESFSKFMPSTIYHWFEKADDLKVVFNAYNQLICADGMTREMVFLRIIQTLEHFHGFIWQDLPLASQAVFKKFLDWMRDNFPNSIPDVCEKDMAELSKNKEEIIKRAAWMNSPNLRTRLKQIFNDMPDKELMPILGNPVNLKKRIAGFLDKTITTRHYLTHYSEENRKKALRDEELEDATLVCWAVLTFWMARYLGIDEELAGDMALKAKRAEFFVNRDLDL